ncbi:hypothetical protein [Bradyrhizobium lablabi]|uniref:hypothetical protein n=1 Tax=Bradyrhizobium lablabi TaxID=722472 RepID=UPI001BAA3861|nr:hypothetical protein [Bradyrhizobium lablabi]MBR0696753.1 hypothetical protein [Bradyrhizobium lablabi]
MGQAPSIIPNDRLDRTFYLVFEDFTNGAAFRETDEGLDYLTLIEDLLAGQYEDVLRVVAFNPAEGWARDASAEVAHDLEQRIGAEGLQVSDSLIDFIESYIGRSIRA